MMRSVAQLGQRLIDGVDGLIQILLIKAQRRLDLEDIRVRAVRI